MRKIFCVLVCMIAITAFAQTNKPAPAVQGQKYGAEITAKGALPVARLTQKMGKADSLDAKVSGTVVDVCQKKGCFMTLDLGNGETMTVRFKDYGFFVPTDIQGKTVVVDGFAKQETLSVEDLQHNAKDAKKSEEEIAKITQPKKLVTFEAKGVVVL
ncbi:DUF4920 domain-containing protein [Hufsiella ginkgonis]|uniref:DUF4920 domain-containing protein n=1 Tax=Hufsiella ginkgonis TaxID=2695274 RepID=A0A7K1XTQ7_9SPHI|nr:DUF4920 domain-containing protein [Hufsiella ginkgonis]MXV14385.1 DUF4920 domain-containing protein [Hufsiella ginkgonis]